MYDSSSRTLFWSILSYFMFMIWILNTWTHTDPKILWVLGLLHLLFLLTGKSRRTYAYTQAYIYACTKKKPKNINNFVFTLVTQLWLNPFFFFPPFLFLFFSSFFFLLFSWLYSDCAHLCFLLHCPINAYYRLQTSDFMWLFVSVIQLRSIVSRYSPLFSPLLSCRMKT